MRSKFSSQFFFTRSRIWKSIFRVALRSAPRRANADPIPPAAVRTTSECISLPFVLECTGLEIRIQSAWTLLPRVKAADRPPSFVSQRGQRAQARSRTRQVEEERGRQRGGRGRGLISHYSCCCFSNTSICYNQVLRVSLVQSGEGCFLSLSRLPIG